MDNIETIKTECTFDLNQLTSSLLLKEPFFAAISRHINKTANKNISTAGVRLNHVTKYFEMIYNPEFFEKLSDEERLAVLKHEFYHVLFGHLTTRGEEIITPEQFKNMDHEAKSKLSHERKMRNIAQDMAINCHVSNLPKMCIFAGEGDFKKYPKFLAYEQYYAMLMNDNNVQQKYKDKNYQFDVHFGDDGEISDVELPEGFEGSEEDRQIAKERLKQILGDAIKEGATKGWGSVSKDCQDKIIEKYKNDAYLDWKSVLRYFIKATRRAEKYSSTRTINKRFPYIQPGRRIRRFANLAISIDQSGSVSDELLSKFYAELDNLSKMVEITIIPFDTEVDEKDVFIWKKGQHIKMKRVKQGGTCFDCCTKYVNERNFDGHIILTDLQAPRPIHSKCKRMWLTDKQNYEYSTSFIQELREQVVVIK